MKYTVIWRPSAEADLASIWTEAQDRHTASWASNQIDLLLRSAPTTSGESRSGDTRILVVPPLAVHFEVVVDGRKVYVLTVRFVAKP
jgi:plasmid stabilization system protein ParE